MLSTRINIDILSAYKGYFTHLAWSNINLVILLVFSPPTPEENILLFSMFISYSLYLSVGRMVLSM